MNKKILKIALPNIISNITVPLLGLVDISMMGHLNSEKYLGAIALGITIFNFIYISFIFLRMGTSGFTAQAYGEKNFTKSINWLVRALLVSVIAGIFLIILQIPIEWLALNLIEGSVEIENLAAQYFRIRIWAAPATISMYAITGWLIGMQNTKSPMIVAIFINIVNIGANLIFVFGMDMKSDGVALGTLIAQYSGLVLILFILKKYYGNLFKYIKIKVVLHLEELKKFAKVNSNILIRTLSLIGIMSFFTSVSAKMGDDILAVNTLLLQFFMFFSYLIDGFAYAAEALTGKYLGAKDFSKLKLTIKYIFIWAGAVSLVFTGIYLFGFKQIINLLTNNLKITNIAISYKWWVIAIPIFSFAAFIWDGIYIGLTSSKEMRNTMLLASLLFFILWFTLKDTQANNALWFSMLFFLASRGVIQTIYFRKISYY